MEYTTEQIVHKTDAYSSYEEYLYRMENSEIVFFLIPGNSCGRDNETARSWLKEYIKICGFDNPLSKRKLFEKYYIGGVFSGILASLKYGTKWMEFEDEYVSRKKITVESIVKIFKKWYWKNIPIHMKIRYWENDEHVEDCTSTVFSIKSEWSRFKVVMKQKFSSFSNENANKFSFLEYEDNLLHFIKVEENNGLDVDASIVDKSIWHNLMMKKNGYNGYNEILNPWRFASSRRTIPYYVMDLLGKETNPLNTIDQKIIVPVEIINQTR